MLSAFGNPLDYVRHQLDREPKLSPRTVNHRLGVVRCLYRFHYGREIPAGQSHFQRTYTKRSPLGYGRPRRAAALGLRLRQPRRVVVPLSADQKRVLPLPPEIIEVLEKYPRLERPLTHSCSLFVSLKGRQRGRAMTPAGLRSLFRHHRLRSQVPHANPHRFRHTFGADMARAGISLPALEHLLGHSQIHTTMLYVQLAPEDVWREYACAAGKRTRLGSSRIL